MAGEERSGRQSEGDEGTWGFKRSIGEWIDRGGEEVGVTVGGRRGEGSVEVEEKQGVGG